MLGANSPGICFVCFHTFTLVYRVVKTQENPGQMACNRAKERALDISCCLGLLPRLIVQLGHLVLTLGHLALKLTVATWEVTTEFSLCSLLN